MPTETLLRSALRILVLLPVLGCNASDGQRCDPAEYSNRGTAGDCGPGLACVYPTAPSCGVSYCCKVGTDGAIVDDRPSCQPDPTLVSACQLDLGEATADAAPSD